MKKNVIAAGAALVCAVILASCGTSKESAYRKAYEKAKAQENSQMAGNDQQAQQTPVVTPLYEAPAQQTTTAQAAPAPSGDAVRSESLKVVDGEGLKAYSVVVGSFGVKANAESLQARLKAAGYPAQVAYSAKDAKYRVVANTFDSKASAEQSRNALNSAYPGAWLLFNK